MRLIMRWMGLAVTCWAMAACNSQDSSHAPTPKWPGPAAFEGVGRAATDAEIAAWDIDVRPDFKGLPAGSGSVEQGEELWIDKCASCHGDFGDANHVFVPLVGNTSLEDIETGRVAALRQGGKIRTTFTKVATVSTLWDYIYRAMPWDSPKSLSADEVYALLAYLLNLAEIVPYEYELSEQNIAEVQARMPNRNGMTRAHGLWKIDGEPDTNNSRCMEDCVESVSITSSLPDYARDAHGNLADQNRRFGPVRGAVTVEADAGQAGVADRGELRHGSPPKDKALQLAKDKGCLACHGLSRKLIGPALDAIAMKHSARKDIAVYLSDKIRNGGVGTWGQIPMPPQAGLSDAEVNQLAQWIARHGTP